MKRIMKFPISPLLLNLREFARKEESDCLSDVMGPQMRQEEIVEFFRNLFLEIFFYLLGFKWQEKLIRKAVRSI